MWLYFKISNFQTHIKNKHLECFLWNCLQVNVTGPPWRLVNIGSDNGLVPSGIKPLFEPMLTKSYDKFYMTYTSFSEPYLFFYCNLLSVYLPDRQLPIWPSLLVSNWDSWKHVIHVFGRTGTIWDSRSLRHDKFISFFNSVHQFFYT